MKVTKILNPVTRKWKAVKDFSIRQFLRHYFSLVNLKVQCDCELHEKHFTSDIPPVTHLPWEEITENMQ